jgi:hypothetical protein
MLEAAPARMPRVMPMSAIVASDFSTRYPAAAAIFDNLHALHDVVADILASPTVPPSRKRAATLAAAAAYRDDVTQVVSGAVGDMMSDAMGDDMDAAAMGGTARQAFVRPATPSRDR